MVNKNINQKKKETNWSLIEMKSDLETYQNEKIMQVSNRKLHTNTKHMWRDEFAYEISCIVKCL
jgi:hypothetical protein